MNWYGVMREPLVPLRQALRSSHETLSALAAVGEGDASSANAVLRTWDALEDGAFAERGRTRFFDSFAGIGFPMKDANRAELLVRIRAALDASDPEAKQAAALVIHARDHELEDDEAAPLVPLLARSLNLEFSTETIPALGSLGARAASALPSLEAIASEDLPSLFTNHRERERQRIVRETIEVIRAALKRK